MAKVRDVNAGPPLPPNFFC